MKRWGFLIGLAFGFLLGAGRLGNYQAIHDMLALRDPYIFLMMGSSVLVAALLLLILERKGLQTRWGGTFELKRYPVSRKDFLGGTVFGIGWAITGSCPGATLAMIGGGSLLGVVVALGIFGGLILRQLVVVRAEAQQQQAPATEPAAIA